MNDVVTEAVDEVFNDCDSDPVKDTETELLNDTFRVCVGTEDCVKTIEFVFEASTDIETVDDASLDSDNVLCVKSVHEPFNDTVLDKKKLVDSERDAISSVTDEDVVRSTMTQLLFCGPTDAALGSLPSSWPTALANISHVSNVYCKVQCSSSLCTPQPVSPPQSVPTCRQVFLWWNCLNTADTITNSQPC